MRRALIFVVSTKLFPTNPGAARCSLAWAETPTGAGAGTFLILAWPPRATYDYGAASGRASRVRGKPKTNVLIVVVGRVVVTVGRAQVDRLIVPGATARSLRSADSIIPLWRLTYGVCMA